MRPALLAAVVLAVGLSSAQASDRPPADPEARRLVSEVQRATERVLVAVERMQGAVDNAKRSFEAGKPDDEVATR